MIRFSKAVEKILEKNSDFLLQFMEKECKLFEKIDNLINSILEFYVIIKLLSVNKPTIIHMGLYHTSNIIYKLVTEYDCKNFEYGLKIYQSLHPNITAEAGFNYGSSKK